MDDPEAKRAFDIYDSNGQGTLSKEDSVQALRVYGLNPTEADILVIYGDFSSTEGFQLEDFGKLIEKCKATSRTNKEDVTKYFESFVKGEDRKADVRELKAALTGSGDALSNSEIDEAFSKFASEGRIDIYEFVEAIFRVN